MPIITVFYIKLLLSAALTSAILWSLWKSEYFERWQARQDTLVFTIGFLLFRLIPWAIIFVILDMEPRGDVPFFFYKAEHAKLGEFVYRDFWSYHAPFYAYIISIPLWFWHNPRSIVLLMVLMETLILWGTYRTYKARVTNALQLTFLYWLLPASFMYIMVDGQEEIWFWGIGLLIWRYLLRNRENYEVGLGLLFALALVTLKVTFIFLLPAILVLVRKPIKMLLTMAAVGVPVVGVMYYFIGDLFLMPIRHTEQLMTPNLFSVTRPLIELFVHIDETNSTAVNWIGLLFTVLLPCMAAWKARPRQLSQVFPGLFILSYCGMMIFQASAPGAYVIAFLVFEIIDVNKWRDILVITALGWLTVIQPFVNVYIGQPDYVNFSMFLVPKHLLDITLQILNVLCFIWICVKAWNKVVTPKTAFSV
jgi:hypothetical protein